MSSKSILGHFHEPKTSTIAEYCELISRDTMCILKESDPSNYRKLCTQFVLIPEDKPPFKQLSNTSHGSTVRDVLHRTIATSVRATGNMYSRGRNLLSLGYRSKRWDSELELRNSMGIECYCVNTLHSYFINTSWDMVLDRVGEDILQHLLTRPILIPVRNGSYVQICGEPIPSLIFRPDLRRKNYHRPIIPSCNDAAAVPTAHADEMLTCPELIPRYRLFYKDNRRRPSLPSRHMLNKVNVSADALGAFIFNHHISSPSQCPTCDCLLQLCTKILESYKSCDIMAAFSAHCKESTGSNRSNPKKRGVGVSADENDSCSGCRPVHKKRRRGCRAGRKKGLQHPRNGNCKQQATNSVRLNASTPNAMPDHIVQRVLRNGILDKAVSSQGLASQESGDGDSNCFHFVSSPSKWGGQSEAACAVPNDKEWSHQLSMRSNIAELSIVDSQHIKPQFVKGRVDFLKVTCPVAKVCEFVKSVCRRLFPLQYVWGTRRNRNVFMKSIDTFVVLGRSESITVQQLCLNYKRRDIPWICKSETKKTYRCTKELSSSALCDINHHKLADQQLKWFIYWIFTDVIIPLLSVSFYITDGEGTGTESLYYPQKIWRELSALGEIQMKRNFVEISATPFMDADPTPTIKRFRRRAAGHPDPILATKADMNYPTVRFVPKKSSIRAITNMSQNRRYFSGNRKSLQQSQTLSNSSLYNCLYVLRDIARQSPGLLGFGANSVDDACRKLREYKLGVVRKQLMRKRTSRPVHDNGSYFAAVLDLEKCFDSVDTAQLYDIVRNLVKSTGNHELITDSSIVPSRGETAAEEECEASVIHRYSVTHYISSAERFVCRSLRHVTDDGDVISFQEAADEISRHYQDAIITDGVVHSLLSRSELLRLIRLHLFSHVVRIPSAGGNDKFYTQVRGIPQGSVLSPLLCNIYYGSAEQRIFGSDDEMTLLGLKDNSSVIIRVVDDYIAISTDRKYISYFLERIHSCFGPFGGGVNAAKTRVNFDAIIKGSGERITLRRSATPVMQWCGFDIDTRTLEISPSFCRILDRPVIYSLNRDCFQHGTALRRIMKSFVRPKCPPIILDAFMNSYETVVKSLHQLFSVAALRTHSYIRGHSKLVALHVNSNVRFLNHCVVAVIRYGACLLKTRTVYHRHDRTLHLGLRAIDTFPNHSGSGFILPYSTEVTAIQAEWIGLKAFISTLTGLNRAVYKPLTDVLQFNMKEMEERCCSQLSRQLRDIVASIPQHSCEFRRRSKKD